MKIYAIRDKLIDYFMQPFAGPDDKTVLGAIALGINTQGNMNDIAQAPQHYEVWRLGEVSDSGNLIPGREIIAQCSGLVRPGLRAAAPESEGDRAVRQAVNRSESPPQRTSEGTRTLDSPLPSTPPSEAQQG